MESKGNNTEPIASRTRARESDAPNGFTRPNLRGRDAENYRRITKNKQYSNKCLHYTTVTRVRIRIWSVRYGKRPSSFVYSNPRDRNEITFPGRFN